MTEWQRPGDADGDPAKDGRSGAREAGGHRGRDEGPACCGLRVSTQRTGALRREPHTRGTAARRAPARGPAVLSLRPCMAASCVRALPAGGCAGGGRPPFLGVPVWVSGRTLVPAAGARPLRLMGPLGGEGTSRGQRAARWSVRAKIPALLPSSSVTLSKLLNPSVSQFPP